ncbi:MAG: rhodanese-like domain-containing protein [Pseudomonadota bacterium]
MKRRIILLAGVACALTLQAKAQDSFGQQPTQQQPQQQQQQQPQQQHPTQQAPQQQWGQQSYPAPQQQQPAPQQQQWGGQQQSPQQQPMQQQPMQQPPGGGYGAPGQMGQMGMPNFANSERMETQDFGVAATSQLHSGAMHGPTPTTIPGGIVITTQALHSTLQQNPQGIAIFDVLGGPEVLPGAMGAVAASTPGSFNDQTQQQFGGYLQQVTGGNKQTPVLFYCQSAQCWMSYNAALRAINMGYTQVLWYRGGIEAWKAAGLPMQNPYANQGGQPY